MRSLTVRRIAVYFPRVVLFSEPLSGFSNIERDSSYDQLSVRLKLKPCLLLLMYIVSARLSSFPSAFRSEAIDNFRWEKNRN